ncbi:unnamed protein product [Lymnaea stagnalis]|uniref:Uncharacterized protein n=1 Tax=Lymnaea stagnalis TaxID=6523 RepID=A0AAV2HMU5_LYMST
MPGYLGDFCDNECKPGTWGEDCKSSCGANCIETSCNRHTGFCDQGCVKGFHGNTCSLPCPEKCENRECDRVDRSCLKCLPGYSGPLCDQVITQVQGVSERDKIIIFSMGVGVGLISFMLLLCVICMCRAIMRKRPVSETNRC